VARPGYRLEAFGLDFLVAGDAESVGAVLQALERFIDELQRPAVVVALVKEKFLGIGIGRLVGDVLRTFLVRLAAVLLGLGDGTQQLLLLAGQPLPVDFDFLFVHTFPYFAVAYTRILNSTSIHRSLSSGPTLGVTSSCLCKKLEGAVFPLVLLVHSV